MTHIIVPAIIAVPWALGGPCGRIICSMRPSGGRGAIGAMEVMGVMRPKAPMESPGGRTVGGWRAGERTGDGGRAEHWNINRNNNIGHWSTPRALNKKTLNKKVKPSRLKQKPLQKCLVSENEKRGYPQHGRVYEWVPHENTCPHLCFLIVASGPPKRK